MLAEKDQELMLKDKEIHDIRVRGGSLNATRSSSLGNNHHPNYPTFNQTWGHPSHNNTGSLTRETLKECSREVSELIRELQDVILVKYSNDHNFKPNHHISSRQILRELINIVR